MPSTGILSTTRKWCWADRSGKHCSWYGLHVNPIEGLELSDQLHDAVKYIHGTYQEAELPELGEGEAIDTSIPADPNVKNYSYAIVDGQVYYRENSRMVRPDLNATAEARVKGLVGLRDCVPGTDRPSDGCSSSGQHHYPKAGGTEQPL